MKNNFKEEIIFKENKIDTITNLFEGKERIDEVFDPEKAINRAIEYYRKKGYDNEWIKCRLDSILNRKTLTDVWKECYNFIVSYIFCSICIEPQIFVWYNGIT